MIPASGRRSGARSGYRSIKQWLKARLGKARAGCIRRFRSYDADRLSARLSEMGIARGDHLLVHSAYRPTNGFRGTPHGLIDVLRELVGEHGTVVMPSMSYTSSTKQYLATGNVFDVRRTPSQMGIVTEIFRRSGAKRSLCPTHPLLAIGEQAHLLLDGHERCMYPCGPGSPFERLLKLNGKVLFFDLPFVGFTFLHYIEHELRDRLPYPLYEAEPMRARCIDHDGVPREWDVFVFTDQASVHRRVEPLTEYMRRATRCSWGRLGNTELVVVSLRDSLDSAIYLAERGVLPCDTSCARIAE